ncbi:hypothetical protein SDC9_122502 [bioreactor metagenome]|uniref:Uncharacterized protein n=1 Tax=bioreactor metagenome TaxID=1076179 RepID=A0A645CEV8_9ZZZZ
MNLFGASNVFDYLPTDGTPYPFVFVGEQLSNDQRNKSAVFGTVTQTVHVYHNDYKKRGTTTSMVDNIKTEVRNLKATPHFHVDVRNINGQVLPDNSTATPLLHGIIEIEFHFN